MLWSVFVLTAGGISLMFYMLRHGQVTRVQQHHVHRAQPDGADGLGAVRRDRVWLCDRGHGRDLAGVYLVVARR